MDIDDALQYGLKRELINELKSRNLEKFTSIQVEALKAGLCTGESLVISSPTSSGKTTIGELAAVEGALNGRRSVYLVTHRALAEEKYETFKALYDSENKWFEVSIATGDRVEGEWNTGILVATYEKFIAVLCTKKQGFIDDIVVIADELQILSDKTRGSDIEILCTILKKNNPAQFIGLSATTPNIQEISDWLKCKGVLINYRDVPLRQELYFRDKKYYCYSGDPEIFDDQGGDYNTLKLITELVNNKLSPVLVFTMTKPRARQLALEFSSHLQQDIKTSAIIDQLDFFTESTTISEELKQTTEKRVAFHTADLSFSERSVVEDALRKKDLDVVIATPTLASGVNFPVRTVLFDSFHRKWIPEWVGKSEYMNMAGRAGRLGYHDEGLVILQAENQVEYFKGLEYIRPEQEPVNSVLLEKSIRKSVLYLVAAGYCNTETSLDEFYNNTYWWHQNLEKNNEKLKEFPASLNKAIIWLVENELIKKDNSELSATRLGVSVAGSGLLPSTAVEILNIVKGNQERLISSFSENLLAILHVICASEEFKNGRYLPFARQNQPHDLAWQQVVNSKPFLDPDLVDEPAQVANAAFGLSLWVDGVTEKRLRQVLPPISYGQLHGLAADVSWIIDGVCSMLRVPGVGLDDKLALEFSILSDRVRHGVPADVLDILKAAKKYNVPGFGRQRAMSLHDYKLSDPNVILSTSIENLNKVLEIQERSLGLVDAISRYFDNKFIFWKNKHIERSYESDRDADLVVRSYDKTGTDYEDVVLEIFLELGIPAKKFDTGKKQGAPDILLEYDGKSLILECKTKDNNQATIGKEDAFSVLIKAMDIACDHKATLGKPQFNSFTLQKAAASKDITLITHYVFIEALFKYWEGEVSSDEIFNWLLRPGVADSRLLGN